MASIDRMRAPVLGAVVIAAGIAHATALRWLCDDAFISFRYARNLVDGLGLVFNAGEKVEGYSNPLWTLLLAGAMALRLSPETTSIVLGIAAYAAGLAVLVWIHERMRARLGVPADAVTVPVAALIGALQPDWAIFATSGLETSLFTTLSLAGMGIVLVGDASARRSRGALAGLFFGLASITRHEGVLLATLAGVCLALEGGRPRRGDLARRLRSLAMFAGAALVVWVPFTAWRVHYYGHLFPNTYYSKSGGSAYWSAGVEYVALYLQRAWFVPLGILVALLAGIARVPVEPSAMRWRSSIGRVASGAGFVALVYSLYIARVGGDFMFARMLVPVTPLFLLLLDAGLLRFVPEARSRAAETVIALCAPLLGVMAFRTPCPVSRGIEGVVDEHAFYDQERSDRLVSGANMVRPFLQGLPVRVAIYGAQARLAYLVPFPVAIEAQNGLTDAHVAHQKLAERGRPGHEKPATLEYLIGERKVDLTFSVYPERRLGLDEYVPRVWVRLGDVEAQMMHWDPEIVGTLRARGAQIDDFVGGLDRLIAQADTLTDDQVRAELTRCDHFYFDGGYDPARRALLVRRLERGPGR